MLSNLLHSLDVFSDLGFEQVRGSVEVAAVTVVVATVDEPFGNSEGDWVGNDLLDLLPGLFADFTSTGVEVDLRDLANQVSESGTNTSDGSQRVGDLALAFQVSVQHSDNVLEFSGVFVNEALALISSPSVFTRLYKCIAGF